ncbi:hypothetical protein XhhCFBP4925_04775 [Xanthomonas hortorum pv. hederae]|nr:hypothetical protein XhhCFBP4925_04775 [Xanthomonas hortorum pv. hederae]PUF01295.1 hypothetical protein C7T87_03720 [Xanthomonas hortorum pv. hederae]
MLGNVADGNALRCLALGQTVCTAMCAHGNARHAMEACAKDRKEWRRSVCQLLQRCRRQWRGGEYPAMHLERERIALNL